MRNLLSKKQIAKKYNSVKIGKAANPKELAAAMSSLVVIAAMLALIIQPTTYMAAFSDGLILFAVNVLPALFPFFFLTKLLSGLGLDSKLGKLFSPLMRLFNAPSSAGYVFAMSLLCGYPIGAKLTEELYLNKQINYKDALCISSFCSTSGPIFVIGTVGGAIFSSPVFGIILLVSNYLSAILNGLLWRKKNKSGNSYVYHSVNQSFNLGNAVYDSVISVMLVGAYIALFNMLGELLINTGLLKLLSGCIDKISFNILQGLSDGLAFGAIEITRGCVMLCDGGEKPLTAASCSAIIAFGGLGIALQSVTLLSPVGIKFRSYIARKSTQAVIGGISAYILASLFL